MEMTLSDAPTLVQSGSGSNGNGGVLHTPEISKARVSSSDGLMSYQGHSVVGSYSSAEMQSVYSTAPANCAEVNSRVDWIFYTR